MAPQKLITSTRRIVPNLRQLSVHGLNVSYDRGADVLYVSFGKPQSADEGELTRRDVIVRRKGNRVVGLTFLNASRLR